MTHTKFKCPQCESATQVIDSRCKTPYVTRRRRLCTNPKCGYRVTTIERIFSKDQHLPKVEMPNGNPPLFLFTVPARKDFFKVIQARTRKEARNIAIEKGWTQKLDWKLTYLGFPAKKT